MTVEEIKAKYSMRDITAMYGITPNRSGFCKCPFHTGDHTASLKIYKDDFNCFGCGANGDIFKFIMLMDECDFKTAYTRLGGTYSKSSLKSKVAVYRASKRRVTRSKRDSRIKLTGDNINMAITEYRNIIEKSEPMSEEWADAINKLQLCLYMHGEFHGMEY